MSNITQPHEPGDLIESVIMRGDFAALKPEQRVVYYRQICETLGLNPLTQPFAYITLNSKLCLYARKDATDQLRKIHKISVSIVKRERIEDVYVVTARAQTPEGRSDESTGAVAIGNSKGDALANALMKAETKSKRRVTLSICGLGFLDETETETILSDHQAIGESRPAIEHRPNDAPRESAKAVAPPSDPLEFEANVKRLDALWSKKGACAAGYILGRMTAWAREEMGCDLPVAQWPTDIVAAAHEQMKEICARLKEESRPIGADEQRHLVEMLARKGRQWSAVIRAHNLPGNAAAKDLSRGQWQTIMAQLDEEPDTESARPADKTPTTAEYEDVPY